MGFADRHKQQEQQHHHASVPASPKRLVLHDEYRPQVAAPPSIRSHPNSRGRQPSTAPTAAAGRRFLAGELFFNYEVFGSLRPELLPIHLFSSEFLGLAISAFAAGFTFTMMRNAYQQLLSEYMRVHDESSVPSIKFLLEWPGSFAILIGFLSDCRPMGGRRRKPYMIIG